MKMHEYLARLLLQARNAATGELHTKLTDGLRGMGVDDPAGPGAEVAEQVKAALAKGGRKKALGLVTEAGRMAREEHTAACERLHALTALQRHLNDNDRARIVMPWEQKLADGCAPLAEMLRAQNAILTEPLKKKKEDGEGELDVELPSGVLAELYAEALGYDRLTRLCKELGLDLDNPDHVLDLDAALAGLVAEYSLQQKRSEQVAKQAKRHAEELESQRYAILAASRPIHERAEAIRADRRNPTIPGINMDPPKKEAVPPAPPAMPTADQIAASLFELMQQKARQAAARQQGQVLEAAPEPAGLLGDGRVSWRALNLWGKQSQLKAGSTVRRLLLSFYRDGALAELCDWLFVPPPAVGSNGTVLVDGEAIAAEDAADVGGVIQRLPAPDQIDWTGFAEPLLASIPGRRDGRDQVRSIDSHRVLTAHEISTIDLGWPAEQIRAIEYDDILQATAYVVTYEEHADHLAKKGRDETVAAEKAEPAKKPKKKGKR